MHIYVPSWWFFYRKPIMRYCMVLSCPHPLSALCPLTFPATPSRAQPIAAARKRSRMASPSADANFSLDDPPLHLPKIIDSHLHVWASPLEASDKYPYHPGQEPALPGHADYLLECMEDSGVDGALIVQPINHKFDHSLVTSVLKKYPSKFAGCCLANPAEDGSGINQFEQLVLTDGYRAVRFNPYLWPAGQKMANEVGKALFCKAGELGVPVGIMCMKGFNLHVSEIEQLCSCFPSTVLVLDHLAFCRPPMDDEEQILLAKLLELSKFPQVYLKFSALFRLTRKPFPYEDLTPMLSQVISRYGSNRVMWGSDFPFVVPECGYGGAKEAIYLIANQLQMSSADLEWIMGRTVMKLFPGSWTSQSH